MPQDYYEVLNVSRDADQETIKKAFRQMAVKYHPDKNPGNKEAEDKFKEAATAYEILGNPEKRSQYDRLGHQAFSGLGGQAGGFSDINDVFSSFGDIFSDIFGEGGFGGVRTQRGRRGPSRGSDLRYRMDIGLEDVIQGIEKEIEYETESDCQKCHGSGADPQHKPKRCPQCGGSGQVVRAQGFFSMSSTCAACHGEGEIIKKKCRTCHGYKRKTLKKKIKVKVPSGVNTGTRLRIAGEGEGGYRRGGSGDLYVEIYVREHPHFERLENDIYGKVEVTYLQAILGAEVSVKTLDGQKTIEIPPGTQPQAKVRVMGQGVPLLRGHGRGDMYFVVDLKIPKRVSKKEGALLRELKEIGQKGDKSRGFFRK